MVSIVTCLQHTPVILTMSLPITRARRTGCVNDIFWRLSPIFFRATFQLVFVLLRYLHDKWYNFSFKCRRSNDDTFFMRATKKRNNFECDLYRGAAAALPCILKCESIILCDMEINTWNEIPDLRR